MIGILHLVAAVVALLSGAVVLLRRKGDGAHRRLGKLYFASMLVLNLTAFLIYRLFGAFGPFHVAAAISLTTVVAGVAAAWRRRPGWLVRHYYWMSFSYVGLVAAAASEALTRLPRAPFWWAVAGASLVTMYLGAAMIHRRAEAVLSRVPQR